MYTHELVLVILGLWGCVLLYCRMVPHPLWFCCIMYLMVWCKIVVCWAVCYIVELVVYWFTPILALVLVWRPLGNVVLWAMGCFLYIGSSCPGNPYALGYSFWCWSTPWAAQVSMVWLFWGADMVYAAIWGVPWSLVCGYWFLLSSVAVGWCDGCWLGRRGALACSCPCCCLKKLVAASMHTRPAVLVLLRLRSSSSSKSCTELLGFGLMAALLVSSATTKSCNWSKLLVYGGQEYGPRIVILNIESLILFLHIFVMRITYKCFVN